MKKTKTKIGPRPHKIKEVRATRFILEDSQGNTKASCETHPGGVVLVDIFGADRACLSAQIDRDGNPKLNFRNKKGQNVMGLGVSDDIGQGLTICDSKGCPVCFIFVGKDDLPRIKLFQRTPSNKLKKLASIPVQKIRKKKKSDPV